VGSSCVAEVVPCSPEDADTCCEEQAAGTGPVVEVVKSAYRMVVGDIGNQRKVTGPDTVIVDTSSAQVDCSTEAEDIVPVG